MPSKRTSRGDAPPEVTPSVDARTGIALLNKLIEKAETLRNKPDLKSSDGTVWDTLARDYLIRVFGSRSPNVSTVIHAQGDGGLYANMSEHELQQYLRSEYDHKIKLLRACIEQLETDIELQTPSAAPRAMPHATGLAGPSSKVFVVHGHNHGVKEAVARFLEKLGLEAVILHEKPNSGRTVIEKFSDYADVHFAIVLLTGDDEGRVRGSGVELLPRARQNVILELGYFLGKLGRSRVCALYEAGVEIPSDYEGVLFVELDRSERWKFDLVRELIAANFDVDANRIFSAD